MRERAGLVFLAAYCWLVAAPPALAALYPITSFEVSYSAYNPTGGLAWRQRMRIYAPTTAGSYPVAVVLGGTTACTDPPTCTTSYGIYTTAVAADAARRGMVAAAVLYDSRRSHFCGCTGGETWTGMTLDGIPVDCAAPNDGWDDKARAVFDHTDPNSALRRIITATSTMAAKASLADGLVVFGHSQGAFIAKLADGFSRAGDGRAVDAALLTGVGIWGYVVAETQPNPYPVACNLPAAAGAVPSSRVRAFDGAKDAIFGVNTVAQPGAPSPLGTPVSLAGVRRSLLEVTGLCTAGVSRCLPLGADGGGWRVVLGANLSTGNADHAFMSTSASSSEGTIDAKWRYGYDGEPLDPPVSLKQNLNWIARKLGSPMRQAP
jgi:hypothetical protein